MPTRISPFNQIQHKVPHPKPIPRRPPLPLPPLPLPPYTPPLPSPLPSQAQEPKDNQITQYTIYSLLLRRGRLFSLGLFSRLLSGNDRSSRLGNRSSHRGCRSFPTSHLSDFGSVRRESDFYSRGGFRYNLRFNGSRLHSYFTLVELRTINPKQEMRYTCVDYGT